MAYVNQNGDPINETVFRRYFDKPDHDQLWDIVCLMLEKQGVEAVLTNATKHGNFEVELRELE